MLKTIFFTEFSDLYIIYIFIKSEDEMIGRTVREEDVQHGGVSWSFSDVNKQSCLCGSVQLFVVKARHSGKREFYIFRFGASLTS